MIMLDLETLGTRPGSAIVALAAVHFEPYDNQLGSFIAGSISPVQPKMRIEGSTVQWWMGQSERAREETFPDNPTWASIEEALDAFTAFYDGSPLWSHGAAFDIVLLEAAYHRHGRRTPWSYRDIRDTRTLYALRPNVKPPFLGTQHNALDDACHQAKWVQSVMREIK
ncbi:MAG: hypothetical protein CGW95_00960 [Phenylobacterium zucineum]|nr:MAG: hypothetical protein CGW95_00960 [Phenylobacterium zucineum]